MIIIGFILGIAGDRIKQHFDRKEERKALIVILKADLEIQIEFIKVLLAGFEKIKSNAGAKLGRAAKTVDEGLQSMEVSISLALSSHKSSIVESALAKSHLLPHHVIRDLLQTHRNLSDCERHRVECETHVRAGLGKANPPMPICETYADVMKGTLQTAERLLANLGKLE